MMKKYLGWAALFLLLGAGWFFLTSYPKVDIHHDDAIETKPYLDINTFKTPKGLNVVYVYDETIPAFSLRFSVKGGALLDPEGQEGVTELLSAMLDEGAGPRTAEEFQNDMDRYGVKISFSASRDYFRGAFMTTNRYQDIGVELFSDAINHPHFNSDAVTRMKEALLSNLRFNQMNPQWVAGQELFATLFDGQNYARPVGGTQTSLMALSAEDVAQQRTRLFCRDKLKIAVVGAVKEAQIASFVDQVFGDFPICADENSLQNMALKNSGKTVHIERKGAQSSVMMAHQAVARQDKDWWAVRILDFALGGGQFSSRLMDEVRVKRSLTYGVSSSVVSYDYAPLWFVQSSLTPENTDKAIALIKEIWRGVAENGLRDDEIAAAKKYLIGSLPLALTSTAQVAQILLQIQEDNLPLDILDRRADEINAVTASDITRVAKKILHDDQFVTIIVGPSFVSSNE